MSSTFKFHVTDSATPALQQVYERCNPRQVAEKLRDPILALVRSHYEALPPNKMGAPSTGFWQAASDATSATVSDDGLAITTDKIGVAQRYYGGTINAVRAKYLAIPISIESYGKSPRDFDNLAYVQFGRGQDAPKALVKLSGSSKPETADLNALFIFRKSVHQQPDHTVLPYDDEIFSEIDETLNGVFS